MNWLKTEFQDLYEIPSKNGLTRPARVRGSGYKMINMGELFAHDRIGNIEMELVPMNDKELSSMLVEKGDLLFARQSLVLAGAGKCSIVREAEQPTTFESHIIRLRLRNRIANPDFYFYYFKSPSCGIKAIVTQGVQAGIRGNDLKLLPVHLPPMAEQLRIADVLSTYDDLIENNRRRMALLEEAALQLYREWFVYLRFPGHEHTPIIGGVPEGWEIRPIAAFAAKIGSGATPRGGAAAYHSDGVTLIRSQNVYDFRFEDDGLAFIDEEQAQKLAGVTVEASDILLNITGASVGRCCMVPARHLPARVNQHVMIIRVDPKECGPHYALHTINSHQQKETLLSIARAGGATREALTKDVVSNISFPIPPTHLMNEFEAFARQLVDQGQCLASQNVKLAQARDFLLPRLMNGAIAV